MTSDEGEVAGDNSAPSETPATSQSASSRPRQLGREASNLSRNVDPFKVLRSPIHQQPAPSVADVATVAAFVLAVVVAAVTGIWVAIPSAALCLVAAFILLRRGRVGWVAWALLAAAGIATAVVYLVVDPLSAADSVEEPPQTAQGAEGTPRSGVGGDTAGWFDESGNRAGIAFRDPLTPWKDQASFNCLVGTPSYGDERAFLDASQSENQEVGAFETHLNVTPGDELVLRVYVHNCADPAVNSVSPPRGDAVDTRLRVLAPQDPATHLQVYAFIVSGNADPRWVADGLDLRSETPIRLEFVPRSGRLYGNRLDPEGVEVGDDGLILTSQVGPDGPGTVVGADSLDGVVPADGFRSTLVLVVRAEVLAA